MPDTQTLAPQQQDPSERVSLVVTPLTICEREGHEYQFGYCVDCDQQQPGHEEDGAPMGVVIDDVNFGSYASIGKAAA